jgi:hypothetical protein
MAESISAFWLTVIVPLLAVALPRLSVPPLRV